VVFKDAKRRVIRYTVGVTALSWDYRMAVGIAAAMDGTGCVGTHPVEVKGGPILSSWGRGKKEAQQVYAWIEEELAAIFKSEWRIETPS
jgi:hypothetical protein